MDNEYDVAIVGGGPAGLSAAYKAAEQGLSVIVIEKDDAIGHNIRTSGVTWIEDMKRFGIPSSFYNPISNFCFFSPQNEINIRGKEAKSCVLDVRRTYQFLAEQACSKGANLLIKATVTDILDEKIERHSKLAVKTLKEERYIKSKVIIDASGFNSIIARKIGFANSWQRYGIGAEYECYCSNADADSWTLLVGKQYSEAGYGWIFPLSSNRVRIGVGLGRPETRIDPLKKLNFLIKNRIKPLNRLGNIQPLELHIGFIPNEGLRKKTLFDNILLVGDSAGQANPLVLEGIRYAIEYGRLAGEYVSKFLKEKNRDYLYQYERLWRKQIEKKINAAIKVQTRWLSLSDEEWDKELDIIKDISYDEFYDFIRSDFTTNKMLKLALMHPKMAVRQLFSMVIK